MRLTRRLFLGRGAAATGALAALNVQHTMAGAGMQPFTGIWPPGGGVATGTGQPLAFKNFLTWWTKYGEERARQDAQTVSCLDPDILCLVSASLPTKIRMQQARNYQRIRQERERYFERTLSLEGIVKWWP